MTRQPSSRPTTPNAGTAKTLTATGAVNDGNGGNDYSVTFVTNTSGVVNARPLTVTAAANTKTYDGSHLGAATPTVTAGSLAGDDTAAFIETYDGKRGHRQDVDTVGTVSDGNSGDNYTVTFVPNTTGVVTARPMTVTAVTDQDLRWWDPASVTPTVTAGSLAPR